MKTLFAILINTIFLLSLISCNGQSKKIMEPLGHQVNPASDSLYKPRVNVKVNKEFDSNGNLTRYDSTYSYVYRGGTTGIHDSLFPFNSFLKNPAAMDFFKNPGGSFFNDSLFNHNFFGDDFFNERREMNKLLFDRFLRESDSLLQPLRNSAIRKSARTI